MNSTNVWGNLQPAEQVLGFFQSLIFNFFHKSKISAYPATASAASLGLFKLFRLASTLPRPASCYAICPGYFVKFKTQVVLKRSKFCCCHILICQPDQLALSAPDHRAARQLREKVLSCLKIKPKVKSDSGGEDPERLNHEPAMSCWASHSSELPGEGGRKRTNPGFV